MIILDGNFLLYPVNQPVCKACLGYGKEFHVCSYSLGAMELWQPIPRAQPEGEVVYEGIISWQPVNH